MRKCKLLEFENRLLQSQLDEYIHSSEIIRNSLYTDNERLKGNADRFWEEIKKQDTKIAELEAKVDTSWVIGRDKDIRISRLMIETEYLKNLNSRLVLDTFKKEDEK